MGFFSWKTSDTNESITNIHCSYHDADQVAYLLQPNGKSPIAEASYNGYGVFGGLDAYEWIFENSGIKDLFKPSPNSARSIGIAISHNSDIYQDDNGNYYSFHYPISELNIKPFTGTFATVEPHFAKTPNELIASGEWRVIPFFNVVKTQFPQFNPIPLKFSFNKDAIYEELPASVDCPDQGFF